MTGNLYVTDAETSAYKNSPYKTSPYKTSPYKTSIPSNTSDPSAVFHRLITALQQVLPSANLAKTYVPLLSTVNQPFYLWLIDPDFCHEDLTPAVIENLWNNCPYWVFAWASGQVLAQYILQQPQMVRNKVVMDFGAGSGIVGIAAKMAGAKRVICCDIDSVSLTSCQANAQLNGVTAELLDNLFELKQQFGMDKVDVLLVADVPVSYTHLTLPTILRV